MYHMKGSKGKSVRFLEVVKACSRPEPVTLWTDPMKDRHFKSAVRQNRVMTIEQENVGTRKDVGIIGFIKERNASYFIFPKPLDAFTGMEVRGIKYELIKQPASLDSNDTANNSDWAADVSKTKREKRYCVTIRRIAAVNTSHEVQAKDQKTAKEKALELEYAPDFSNAKISQQVLGVEEL
ncbi:MAG: hypothetical protein JWQ71_2936 [Pedosphaera sp.]|nr:hypothetical protein [Pedosphaera sp.]